MRTHAEAPAHRVLLIGDSITQGSSGMTTWRYWLWRAFGASSTPVTFVGDRNDLWNPRGPVSAYAHLDHGFQTAHGARWGSEYPEHLASIGRRMDQLEPDVVVVELGVNDAKNATATEIARRAGDLASRVWAVDADTKIVYVEIPSIAAGPAGLSPRRNAVTAEANRLISGQFAGDGRVAIARARSGAAPRWDPMRHTYDGVHPNTVGETLLAQRVADALAGLGVLPPATRIYRSAPWTPGSRPVYRVRRGGLVVSWKRDVVRTGATHMRVTYRKVGARAWRATDWIATARHSTAQIRLSPGRYVIRATPRKSWMTGLPTPQVALRVL